MASYTPDQVFRMYPVGKSGSKVNVFSFIVYIHSI